MGKKLAVVFPGIGYHVDKPLLYYGKKLAAAQGYKIVEVPYGGFKKNVKGSSKGMADAFQSALEQTEEILKEIDFSRYDKLLFLSKSIGTAVAAAYAEKHRLRTHNLFYTPVEETFPLVKQEGIFFHGTADPWVETDVVRRACAALDMPLYITEDANHSLETGDALRDIANLRTIMGRSADYIANI